MNGWDFGRGFLGDFIATDAPLETAIRWKVKPGYRATVWTDKAGGIRRYVIRRWLLGFIPWGRIADFRQDAPEHRPRLVIRERI